MKNYKLLFSTCIITVFMISSVKGFCQQNTKNKSKEKFAVVFESPQIDNVIIKKDIPYEDVSGSPLKMDVYYPPNFDFRKKIPAVIMVLGYTNAAGKKMIGKHWKEWIYFVSWGKIISAEGMAAIVYETDNPEKDLHSLSNYLISNNDKLGIDTDRIAAFTNSAHTPTAMKVALSDKSFFQCAVVYNGFFLTNDFKFLPQIDSISKNRGFITPRLPEPTSWKKDIPIMIVRAGKDNLPYIQQSLENFYVKAINQNLPITLINYPDGLHGFDFINDNEITKQIIKNTIEFWRFNLN